MQYYGALQGKPATNVVACTLRKTIFRGIYMSFVKMTALTITCLGALSANVYASTNFDTSCEANINGELSFADNQLLVKSTTKQDIVIMADGLVLVDGKTIDMNGQQTQLAKRYYQDVEASIPMVVDVTVEALRITNIALTEVFTGLLGEDSQLPSKIKNRLDDVAKAIEDHVYQNPDSLTFNSAYLEKDLGLDDNLDAEIENIQNELVSEAMGEMFVLLGKAMLSGDSDFSKFEQRMEKLGEEIEQRVESASVQIEKAAEKLCDKMHSLDETENQLQSVQELRHLDMIDLKAGRA